MAMQSDVFTKEGNDRLQREIQESQNNIIEGEFTVVDESKLIERKGE